MLDRSDGAGEPVEVTKLDDEVRIRVPHASGDEPRNRAFKTYDRKDSRLALPFTYVEILCAYDRILILKEDRLKDSALCHRKPDPFIIEVTNLASWGDRCDGIRGVIAFIGATSPE